MLKTYSTSHLAIVVKRGLLRPKFSSLSEAFAVRVIKSALSLSERFLTRGMTCVFVVVVN